MVCRYGKERTGGGYEYIRYIEISAVSAQKTWFHPGKSGAGAPFIQAGGLEMGKRGFT